MQILTVTQSDIQTRQVLELRKIAVIDKADAATTPAKQTPSIRTNGSGGIHVNTADSTPMSPSAAEMTFNSARSPIRGDPSLTVQCLLTRLALSCLGSVLGPRRDVGWGCVQGEPPESAILARRELAAAPLAIGRLLRRVFCPMSLEPCCSCGPFLCRHGIQTNRSAEGTPNNQDLTGPACS